jgi:hypothetical protein
LFHFSADMWIPEQENRVLSFHKNSGKLWWRTKNS